MINAAEGFYWGIIKAYLVTRDLLVFYSSINNDETPSDIFGMINVADGLYWSLIKAYLVPQDLLAFHSSSRKLMTTLSYEAVFEKGYCHSRTSWTSLKRMNRLMQTRGIWPISPIRTLRLICGKRCEFCYNEDGHSWYDQVCNPVPRVVRPGWPIFCCWPCVSDSRPKFSKESSWPGVTVKTVTRPWSKLIYRPDKDMFYHKQFYLANRQILLNIFNHERILAYPCGFRYLEIRSGEPVAERSNTSIGSRDQIEIMWSTPIKKGGEFVGGLMSADLIQPLVEYLKTPNNLGIDHFLLKMIPNAPALEDYEPFLQAFETIRPKAEQYEQMQSELIQTRKELARLRKIENAIASVSMIASRLTPSDVEIFARNNSGPYERNNRQAYWEDARVFQRIILCYQEEHNLSLHHPLTWDTGIFNLNRALTKLFKPLLRAPTQLQNNEVETYANAFMSICIEYLSDEERWRGERNAVYDSDGEFRTTFGATYRHGPWSTPRRPRSVTREWRGLENSRRL